MMQGSSAGQQDHPAAGPAAWLAALGAAMAVAMALLMPAAAAAEGRLVAHLSSKAQADPPKGAEGLCRRYDWACARGSSARLTADQIRMADKLNRRINASVRPVTDLAQYGREEHWARPTARGGDCEDIALLKKAELIRMDIAPDRLLLAEVLDGQRNNHAVLILRKDDGDYVLDNLTNRMLPWSQTPYTFLRMQDSSAPHRWKAVFAGGIFRG
ncbi:transglutaminase-like cysteine peptidase [Rhodovulum sp.]|uniref:transglutaminase-like cysteine peptidase n=1 Tax=Rhodovulum sp. TaxID=34009 RepID=UPI0017927F1A|nr:transglutaminase-like cysteine peptidase [Rhodovulum sp.]HDR28867.1 hypothetical protein [Rhodovulum sp.]